MKMSMRRRVVMMVGKTELRPPNQKNTPQIQIQLAPAALTYQTLKEAPKLNRNRAQYTLGKVFSSSISPSRCVAPHYPKRQVTNHVFAKVRVKKRLSRFQRFALLTSNEVRGRYLRPAYMERFGFKAAPLKKMIPSKDTADISALLNSIKQEVCPLLLP
jgi:hypothetical protein